MRVSDVDFNEVLEDSFPVGWKTANDFFEVFLTAGSMELSARRRVNPANPFDGSVLMHLDNKFRFDAFGDLINHGIHHQRFMGNGERIGRLPLLKLVWTYTEKVCNAAKAQGRGYFDLMAALEGGNSLGSYGAVIFRAAAERFLAEGNAPSTELSELEENFVQGNKLFMFGSYLDPYVPNLYTDSIWNTAFRIAEIESPDLVLARYGYRMPIINHVLDAGADRGIDFTRNFQPYGSLWPGWPTGSAAAFLNLPSR